MPNLVIVGEGVNERHRIELDCVTLGRGLESDVHLKDVKASRRHCQIVKTPAGYKLVDLSSGNGTLLNGAPVTEQVLKAGDQIQIGMTTITFQETNGTATAPTVKASPATTTRKPGTGPIPTAQGKSTAPATAGTGTRPSTVPAGRPPATAGPKPATRVGTGPQTPARPGTSRVAQTQPGKGTGTQRPAPGTSRTTAATSKPGTQRSTSVTRLSKEGTVKMTGPVSRTARFHADAAKPKKKKNPLVVIGIAAGVLFVGILVIALNGGGNTPTADPVKTEYDQWIQKAYQARESRNFSDALSAARQALARVENEPREVYGSQLDGAVQLIRELEREIEGAKGIEERWASFAKSFKDGDDVARESKEAFYRDLYGSGKQLLAASAGMSFESELRVKLEQVERMLIEWGRERQGQEFAGTANRFNGEFHLNEKGREMWGPAIAAWKGWMAGKSDEDSRQAQKKIDELGVRANDELRKMKNRSSTTAADYREARPRFEGTDCAEEMDALIRGLEGK